jgi:hypothetical protein
MNKLHKIISLSLVVISLFSCNDSKKTADLEGIWQVPNSDKLISIKKYQGNNPGYFISLKPNNFAFFKMNSDTLTSSIENHKFQFLKKSDTLKLSIDNEPRGKVIKTDSTINLWNWKKMICSDTIIFDYSTNQFLAGDISLMSYKHSLAPSMKAYLPFDFNEKFILQSKIDSISITWNYHDNKTDEITSTWIQHLFFDKIGRTEKIILLEKKRYSQTFDTIHYYKTQYLENNTSSVKGKIINIKNTSSLMYNGLIETTDSSFFIDADGWVSRKEGEKTPPEQLFKWIYNDKNLPIKKVYISSNQNKELRYDEFQYDSKNLIELINIPTYHDKWYWQYNFKYNKKGIPTEVTIKKVANKA